MPSLLLPATINRRGALVTLTLTNKTEVLSHNSYWLSADAGQGERTLANMRIATVNATLTQSGGRARVTLVNASAVPALLVKVSVRDTVGRRMLPVYLSDNYVSLMPGERRNLSVSCSTVCPALKLGLRGWNVPPTDRSDQP